jgi:hypothetical protein
MWYVVDVVLLESLRLIYITREQVADVYNTFFILGYSL